MAPKWFQYQVYFENKLNQLIKDDPTGDWNQPTLMEAFEAAGYPFTPDGMYAHFEQWGNTLDENISPNEYFVYDEYMQNKLQWMYAHDSSLNPDNYTLANLEAAFDAAGLTAWNHYTQYGFVEGINPSSRFNTDTYMNDKLSQMKAQFDPNYTMEMLDAAFLAARLNPIEHWYEYGQEENLGFEPAPGPAPVFIWDDKIALTSNDHDVVTSPNGQNVQFLATLSDGETNTLNPGDQIHGGEAPIKNGLLVTLERSNFSGFDAVTDGDASGPAVTGVNEVTLLNNRQSGGVTFNAQNMSGVQTWNLDANSHGAVNVTNLQEGTNANIQNLARGTVNIAFADGANSGADNSMTLGVENSGTLANPVVVSGLANIENLTVQNTTDLAGYVDLSQVAPTNLMAAGAGTLNIAGVGNSVQSFDASRSSGNVTADLTNARISVAGGIAGGSGNDTFVINPQQLNGVPIVGGEGTDTVAVKNASFNGSDAWTGIEQLMVIGGSPTLASGNIPQLQTVIVDHATVTLSDYPGSELSVVDNGTTNSTVNLQGKVTTSASSSTTALDTVNYHMVVPDAQTSAYTNTTSLTTNATGVINIVTDGKTVHNAEIATFGGTVNANSASTLNIDANGLLGGTFNVQNATQITVDAAKGGGTVNLNTGSSGNDVAQLTAYGDITYAGELAGIGDLTINQHDGAFTTREDLSSAHDISINGFSGTGVDVTLGAIGSSSMNQAVTINAANVEDLTLGAITTDGQDVTINVSNATGDFTYGPIVTTPATANGQYGNINVYAATAGAVSSNLPTSQYGIIGQDVTVNLANVTETATGSIQAHGVLQYTGAIGADEGALQIGSGSGAGNTINAGGGADELSVGIVGTAGVNANAQVRVDLGTGDADVLNLFGASANQGNFGITVTSFETAGTNRDHLSTSGIRGVTDAANAAKAINAVFNSGYAADGTGLATTNISNGFYDEVQDIYYIVGGSDGNYTAVRIMGVQDAGAIVSGTNVTIS